LAKIIDAISSRPRLWRGREKDFLKKFYRTPKIGVFYYALAKFENLTFLIYFVKVIYGKIAIRRWVNEP